MGSRQAQCFERFTCISIARRLGISFETIVRGLSEFRGVKRRFEICLLDPQRKRAIVDDYGHHPTEISATLQAARTFWPGRIISVFQPHRYTRTLHCRDGFLSAFLQSDIILITDLYSAGEDPIPGIDAQTLVRDMERTLRPEQKVLYAGDLKATKDLVCEMFTDGDLVLCMGAGTITRLPEQIKAWAELRK